MNTITLKLSAIALGAALFSSAGAVTQTATVAAHDSASLRTSSSYTNSTTMSLQSWDVTTPDGKVFLALCVDPGTPLNVINSAYTAGTAGAFTFAAGKTDAAVRQAAIARLYSHYYGGITGTSEAAKDSSLSFQLALWELNNDNANLKDGTLAFTWNANSGKWSSNNTANQGIINDAASMINYAMTNTDPLAQKYNFTAYTMKDSQTIVVAAPVPEPATYAMLGLGLAVVGFTARRRAKR
jgi:hypothetical protein